MKQNLAILPMGLLAIALATSGAAVAQPPVDANVAIVRTADIDLTQPVGRRVLEQRLLAAARNVCDDASAVDLRAANRESRCRNQVLAKARARATEIAATGVGEPIVLASQD